MTEIVEINTVLLDGEDADDVSPLTIRLTGSMPGELAEDLVLG